MLGRQIIGAKAQTARKGLAQTQKQLSQITGLPQSTLSEIENGRFTGSLDILERYLDALGLELTVTEKRPRLPDWDELDTLFGDES
jgi:transcriptional regulator with XRE-family HTH domain